MAPPLRKETSDIIKNFFENPSSFSFIQAVRLLSLHEKDNFSNLDEFLEQGLSIVPELSLGHPSTDIVSFEQIFHITKELDELTQTGRTGTVGTVGEPIESSQSSKSNQASQLNQLNQANDIALKENAQSKNIENIEDVENVENVEDVEHIAQKLKYKIEVTFLALYGSSSPLPTFYTEELLDESKEDASACRDFFDIFNQLLYIIYYKAFNRYKLALRTIENRDAQLLNLQYALMGFANPHLRDKAQLSFTDLRFIKSFIRYNRSAEDLEVFLSWRLNVAKVEVEQCIARQMPIPKNQYCKLGTPGATLGDAVIGTHITDLSNKIRIHLHNLNNLDMKRFAFSGEDFPQIENCLRIYLDTIPDFDVVLHAEKDALPCLELGNPEKCMLGVTTFLSHPTKAISTEHRISI